MYFIKNIYQWKKYLDNCTATSKITILYSKIFTISTRKKFIFNRNFLSTMNFFTQVFAVIEIEKIIFSFLYKLNNFISIFLLSQYTYLIHLYFCCCHTRNLERHIFLKDWNILLYTKIYFNYWINKVLVYNFYSR